MFDGDEVVQFVGGTSGNETLQDHGKAAKDGPRDEIGGKDRRVPAGQDGGGEVETDH